MILPITINNPGVISFGHKTDELITGVSSLTITNASMAENMKHLCILKLYGVPAYSLEIIKKCVCNKTCDVVHVTVQPNSGQQIKLAVGIWQNSQAPWLTLDKNPALSVPWGDSDVFLKDNEKYDISFRAQVLVSHNLPKSSPLLKPKSSAPKYDTQIIKATVGGMELSGVTSVEVYKKPQEPPKKALEVSREVHKEYDRVFDFEEGV